MPAHIGVKHLHWDATDSTNNRAAEFADNPAHGGYVFTADVQAQGRGQHGRRWQSAPGSNVLLSVLLFPPPPLCRPPVLTALAALAVCATVERLTTQTPRIKWPNDVLVQQKKVAGILIESGRQAEPFFIIGIGLNVNTTQADFDAQALPSATSLHELTKGVFPIADVRATLITCLDEEYTKAMTDSLALLETRWATQMALVNRYVTVELMDASEVQGTLLEQTFDRVTLLQSTTTTTWRPEEIRHIRG